MPTKVELIRIVTVAAELIQYRRHEGLCPAGTDKGGACVCGLWELTEKYEQAREDAGLPAFDN